MAKQAGDFLNGGERFRSRSALWKLMGVSRISRPCALYDTSVAARNSTAAEIAVENPIVFKETINGNFAENGKFIEIGREANVSTY